MCTCVHYKEDCATSKGVCRSAADKRRGTQRVPSRTNGQPSGSFVASHFFAEICFIFFSIGSSFTLQESHCRLALRREATVSPTRGRACQRMASSFGTLRDP
jgi:hypothetical protein